ncbi:MAG: RdgB/HAM1 family non-canonical purine NTP pyrophosphatase [Mycoplasmataceae bacterium]|jgi:XTP/dITP diphosphohydrolase|nr:RdgB/HAM1 family non-canonical purine NTP pyrophosphatase [Mycoplasmataceae bacterium]
MNDIVIATTNKPKFEQMKFALSKLGKQYHFLSLKDIGYKKEIIEDGKTFRENSLIKAKQVCHDTGYITIADDSGLCVDVLNGKPGVYTSRYGGTNSTRKAQLTKLLNEIKNVSDSKRGAQFVCVISCVFPNGEVIQTTGKLCGKLSKKIVNINDGLTHDPIFIPNGYTVTMSKLSIEKKLKINHRGRAIQKLIMALRKTDNERFISI